MSLKHYRKKNMLIALLQKAKRPMTIPEIQQFLVQNGNRVPHKTTLYRQIERLVSAGIVQKIVLREDALSYELQEAHHHHFLCLQCETSVCIEDESLEKQIQELEKNLQQTGMIVQQHLFSLKGLCQQCAK